MAPGGGPLSPELAELATPAVRALPARHRASVIGTTLGGPGSFLAEDGRVTANVRFRGGAIRYGSYDRPEEYSARGPAMIRFGPVSGTIVAPELPMAEVRERPDVVATDCAATTFFARFDGSAWRFCGTSGAALHGAAVAALMNRPGASAPAPTWSARAVDPAGALDPSPVVYRFRVRRVR